MTTYAYCEFCGFRAPVEAIPNSHRFSSPFAGEPEEDAPYCDGIVGVWTPRNSDLLVDFIREIQNTLNRDISAQVRSIRGSVFPNRHPGTTIDAILHRLRFLDNLSTYEGYTSLSRGIHGYVSSVRLYLLVTCMEAISGSLAWKDLPTWLKEQSGELAECLAGVDPGSSRATRRSIDLFLRDYFEQFGATQALRSFFRDIASEADLVRFFGRVWIGKTTNHEDPRIHPSTDHSPTEWWLRKTTTQKANELFRVLSRGIRNPFTHAAFTVVDQQELSQARFPGLHDRISHVDLWTTKIGEKIHQGQYSVESSHHDQHRASNAIVLNDDPSITLSVDELGNVILVRAEGASPENVHLLASLRFPWPPTPRSSAGIWTTLDSGGDKVINATSGSVTEHLRGLVVAGLANKIEFWAASLR